MRMSAHGGQSHRRLLQSCLETCVSATRNQCLDHPGVASSASVVHGHPATYVSRQGICPSAQELLDNVRGFLSLLL